MTDWRTAPRRNWFVLILKTVSFIALAIVWLAMMLSLGLVVYGWFRCGYPIPGDCGVLGSPITLVSGFAAEPFAEDLYCVLALVGWAGLMVFGVVNTIVNAARKREPFPVSDLAYGLAALLPLWVVALTERLRGDYDATTVMAGAIVSLLPFIGMQKLVRRDEELGWPHGLLRAIVVGGWVVGSGLMLFGVFARSGKSVSIGALLQFVVFYAGNVMHLLEPRRARGREAEQASDRYTE